jgi:hypothetical protein
MNNFTPNCKQTSSTPACLGSMNAVGRKIPLNKKSKESFEKVANMF